MDKIELRAVIKYLDKKGLTTKQIHQDMKKTLGPHSPAYATVKKWADEFKSGRDSIQDKARNAGPQTTTATSAEEKNHRIKTILEDRKLKTREVAKYVGISFERAQHIIVNELGFRELYGRWVPGLLTLEQKRNRYAISWDCLKFYEADPEDFLERFITVGETWIHHLLPDLKQQTDQLAELVAPGRKKKVKRKRILSSEKVLVSTFWDARGLIMVDYLHTNGTITPQYYGGLLRRLCEELSRKRPGMMRRFLFHQDNTRVHTTTQTLAEIHNCGFEVLPHPPCSPDLMPADYYLFPSLAKHLEGKKYFSNEEVLASVDNYLENLPDIYFRNGIMSLPERWNKCIDLSGNYVYVE